MAKKVLLGGFVIRTVNWSRAHREMTHDFPGHRQNEKMKALSRLSDLVALMNYAEREIRQLIGMQARAEYVAAFVCSRLLDIRLEKQDSCPFVSGIFNDGPLKDASVQIFRIPDEEGFPAFWPRHRETDYCLFIGGRDLDGKDSSVFTPAWTIRRIYLIPSGNLTPPSPETGTGEKKTLSDLFPGDSEIYPASKSSLLELTDSQRQLLDFFL